MKANFQLVVLFVMLLSFGACYDAEIHTKLHVDGSIDRQFTVESETKSELENRLFPFPSDSTWNKQETIDSTHVKTKHRYIFTKQFADFQAINKEYQSADYLLKQFKPVIKVVRKYRGFYTYIQYTEHFSRVSEQEYTPFFSLLSGDDLSLMNLPDSIANDSSQTKLLEKSRALNERYEKWLEENLKTEIMLAIKHDVSEKMPKFDLRIIDKQSDTLLSYVNSVIEKDNANQVFTLLAELNNNQGFKAIPNDSVTHFQQLMSKVNKTYEIPEFTYVLEMPGILSDTNFKHVQGNKLSMQINPADLFFSDFEVFAESRLTNSYLFYLTGFIVLLAIGLLIYSAFRNKK